LLFFVSKKKYTSPLTDPRKQSSQKKENNARAQSSESEAKLIRNSQR
jgi:hypothetical protein